MVTFQNRKTFRLDSQRFVDKTTSTLLVPNHLVEGLKQKIEEHGCSLAIYFRNLLWMYRALTHSGMLHPPRKIKTEYQDEGLDLKRVSFRVANADWLELGELALAFGKSRCYVFTFLLELDLAGLWEAFSELNFCDAVPTKNNLRLRVSLTLKRVTRDFTRSYHVRV